jgi:FlaG/FlaF family flagellin (archaellin)
MNRKLCRNRRGVSTVIGTILMILVVMAGMSILFGALIVYSDNFHSGSGSSVLESITVEDVYFTNVNVQISIYNTGKVDLTIANVYIDSKMAGPIPNLLIKQGEHGTITLMTPSGTFASDTEYHFKIVTSRGTGFEGTYIW